MIHARIQEKQAQGHVTDRAAIGVLTEKPITAFLTDRASNELFFAVYDNGGERQNLTLEDKNNNTVYLTGERR